MGRRFSDRVTISTTAAAKPAFTVYHSQIRRNQVANRTWLGGSERVPDAGTTSSSVRYQLPHDANQFGSHVVKNIVRWHPQGRWHLLLEKQFFAPRCDLENTNTAYQAVCIKYCSNRRYIV